MSKSLVKYTPTEEVKGLVSQAGTTVDLANAHVVQDAVTEQFANNALTDIHSVEKALKSYKELAIRPLKSELDARNSYFNSALKQTEAAKRILSEKLGAYRIRQEAVAAAAQAEAEAEAEALDMPAPVIKAPQTSAKYRDNWGYEIVDFQALILHVAKRIEAGDMSPDVINMLAPGDAHLKALARNVKVEGEYAPGLKIINRKKAIA